MKSDQYITVSKKLIKALIKVQEAADKLIKAKENDLKERRALLTALKSLRRFDNE